MLGVSCASMACCTVAGTAGTICCDTLSLSLAPPVPFSAAATSHRIVPLRLYASSAGAVISQPISRASPAGICTVCAGSVWASTSVARAVASTVIARCVVLRSVNIARYLSSSRTSRGRPEIICRSCVAAMLALPLPKRFTPRSATATMRKLVSESLSGTSSVALPSPSSCTRGFHSSNVSNSSRVGLLPPPPPAGTALRP